MGGAAGFLKIGKCRGNVKAAAVFGRFDRAKWLARSLTVCRAPLTFQLNVKQVADCGYDSPCSDLRVRAVIFLGRQGRRVFSNPRRSLEKRRRSILRMPAAS
jgi:hypothetical protein